MSKFKCPNKKHSNAVMSWLELFPETSGAGKFRPWCKACLTENNISDTVTQLANFYQNTPNFSRLVAENCVASSIALTPARKEALLARISDGIDKVEEYRASHNH